MGSGQSKFGFGKQKQQYPFPMPTFPGYGPSGQYPQSYIPQYGLSGYPPVIPPGFPQPPPGPHQGVIPPGTYGPGGFVPPLPPQRKSTHRDRRSKKRKSSRRRTHSENFVGGFAGEAPARQDAGPRRANSESHHRNDGPSFPVPEIPKIVPPTRRSSNVGNRAPTPFIPNSRRYDEDDEEEDEGRERSMPRSNSAIRFPEPHPIDGNIRNVLEPLDRENSASAVYGPPGPRPKTPLKNPLPPPPRDIYDMTPYRAIVNLPHTTALLAGPYGPQSLSFANAAAEMEPPAPTKVKRNKSVKGILRAFSKREKEKEKPKDTPSRVYVPVFVEHQSGAPTSSQLTQAQVIPNAQGGTTIQVMVPQSQPPQAPIPQTQAPAQPQPDLRRSASQHSRMPSGPSMPHPDFPSTPQNHPVFPSAPHHDGPPMSVHTSSSAHTPPGPSISPVPPMPSVPPPVRFGQQDALNGFLNHSVYRIMYRNKIYPTGLHLHEAMKFIDNHPDIAEKIRVCGDVHSVYPLSAQFQQFQRADWASVYLQCMEEVITLKVEQHPDLRILLIGTGSAAIEYTDEHDEFWGTGRNFTGQNQLGKVMMRVREKFKFRD